MNTNLNIYKESNYLHYTLNPNLKSIIQTYNSFTYKKNQYPSANAIKESIAEIKKFYTDEARVPDFFQAIFIPQDIIHKYKSLVKAKKTKDDTVILDSKLKLITASVNSIYIISYITTIFAEIGFLFSYATYTLELLYPITGIAASTIAGAIECRNIRRQIRFIAKCTKDLNLLKTDLTIAKKIFFLEKYLGNSSGIQIKTLAKLSNRVSPWFAEKLATELPNLLDTIKSSKDPILQKESLNKAVELLKNAKIQAKKKLKEQSITILATALAIASFALFILLQPIIIPVILSASNILLLTYNNISYKGTNKHIGNGFKFTDCIPAWIKAIKNKAFTSSEKPSQV